MRRSHFVGIQSLVLAAILWGCASAYGIEYTLKQLADINPAGDSFPLAFTEFDSELFFIAHGPQGRELYKTDGIHVTQLADINPAGNAFPNSGFTFGNTFAEFAGELYFEATDEVGTGLFKTDGTSVTRLSTVDPGPLGAVGQTAVFQDELYFTARVAPGPNGLYKTDGVSVTHVGNTSLVGNSNPGGFTAFNGELFFSARGPGGVELFKTNGSTISPLPEINPTGSSGPSNLTPLGGSLYFIAESSSNNRELYKTDGSTVALVTEINPQNVPNELGIMEGGALQGPLTPFNGGLYFSGRNENGDAYEPFKLESDVAVQFADLATPGGSRPYSFREFQGELYFLANLFDVYRTDGENVVKLNPTIASLPTSTPHMLITTDALFDSMQSKRALYITDGVTLSQVTQLTPLGDVVEFGGVIFFVAESQGAYAIYRSDGLEVEKMVDISPSAPFLPRFIPAFGQLFVVQNGADGQELYKVVAVPEPATSMLLIIASAALFGRRYRSHAK